MHRYLSPLPFPYFATFDSGVCVCVGGGGGKTQALSKLIVAELSDKNSTWLSTSTREESFDPSQHLNHF